MPGPAQSPSQKPRGRRRLKRRQERQEFRAQQRRQQRRADRAEDRAEKAYQSKPAAPAAPMVPQAPKYGPLMQRAQRDAQLRYGDQMLRAQAQVNNAGTYFDQYKADVAKAQQAVADRYAAAQQALTAPVQGPAVSSPEGDQAAASRQVLQQAQQNALQAQGNAQQDYFTGRGTVGSAAQLQARQQATSQVNQLATEKDTYALSRRDELRDKRHQRRLENKAFELDVAKAQSDAANDVADNRRAARDARRDRRDDRRDRRAKGGQVNQYGYTEREWRGMSTAQRQAAIKAFKKNTALPDSGDGPGDAKNPFSAKDQASSRRDFRKVFQDIKRNDNGTEKYGPQIRKALTGAGADSLLVNAAWQMYKRGSITPGLAKSLKRDYGITVQSRKKGTSRPAPYSPPQNFPGSDAAQG